jgi:hypothetical protein
MDMSKSELCKTDLYYCPQYIEPAPTSVDIIEAVSLNLLRTGRGIFNTDLYKRCTVAMDS